MQDRDILDRRQRRTKIAFHNALRSLIAEKDLKDITVKEVADRADRDRKTFYLHYESVDALFDEILKEGVEEIVTEIAHNSVSSNGEINIKTFYTALAEKLSSRIEVSSPTMQHISTSKIINSVFPILVDTIKRHDAFDISNKLGSNYDMFVSYFCAGILFLYSEWITGKTALPIEVLADLSGAITESGIKALVSEAEKLNIKQYS